MRNKSEIILSRHFMKNDRMLWYRRIHSIFLSNTMIATPKSESTMGKTCSQLFVSDKVFVATYTMRRQEEFNTELHLFWKEIDVPVSLIVDDHRAQTSIKLRIFCDQVGTILKILVKSTHWTNRAEMYIGLLKEAVRKYIHALHSPIVLWDYAI